MFKIKELFAREILDSRGEPTIEVVAGDGINQVTASIPSGASTGDSEACELRDGDMSRYYGKGVLKACANVNGPIKQAILGAKYQVMVEIDQRLIDLDSTNNKSRLGANAILGVSLACAKLMAKQENLPVYLFLKSHFDFEDRLWSMPTPLANIINGGLHADNNLDVQEFWTTPQGISPYFEKLRAIAEVFHHLGLLLKKQKLNTNVGNEGGYAPNLKSTEEAWKIMAEAVKIAGYNLGGQMFFGFDAGASEWQKNQDYYWQKSRELLTAEMLKQKYLKWFGDYPFIAVEDPFAQEDWITWKDFTSQMKLINPNLTLIGDDLFTTNVDRLEKGINMKAGNAILIKPNQIGTLSETILAIKKAQSVGWKTIISHRSGETSDDFVADLAVAVGSEYVKFGAPSRSERLSKYNRLLVIESELIQSKLL